MVMVNRFRHTWERDVDAFVALSAHASRKFVAGGLPPDRLFIKPNFVDDPGPPPLPPSASNTIVFLGRLSKEKGLASLLYAWHKGGLTRYGRLLIIGDGPERSILERQAAELDLPATSVSFAGWKSLSEARKILRTARALVLPSVGNEGFPMSMVEALSCARPVIASRLQGLLELLPPDNLSAEPGNAEQWAETLTTILTSPAIADHLGNIGRALYFARYTPESNYETLMRIYHFARERKFQSEGLGRPA